MSDEAYYNELFDTPELQGELLNFQLNNPSEGLTTDDLLWFTHGEVAVRSWLPHMEELTTLIKARQNLASIRYYKQQLLFQKLILDGIGTNDLEQLHQFIRAGQELFKDKFHNQH